MEDYFILPEKTKSSEPSWFGFPLTIRDNKRLNRKDLTIYLERHNIGTRLLFGGNLIRQPYFKGSEYKIHENLKNTDKIAEDTFWVGVHPSLDNEMLDYIYECITSFLRKNV